MNHKTDKNKTNDLADAWKARALAAERALVERTPESIQRHRDTIETLEPYWHVA